MNALIAALLIVLPMVETPHGVPLHPGPAGETGPYALTPRVRIDRGRELRKRGEPVTDEAIAREQILWITRGFKAANVDPNLFNIALAWNCGLEQTLQGKAPERSFDFARRVENLVEIELQKLAHTEEAQRGNAAGLVLKLQLP